MKRKELVALALTLSCLFSIVAARITVKSVVTPAQCVIHNLPASTVVLFNSATGVIGEVAPFPMAWENQFSSENGEVLPATYYNFECQYPDFTITADSVSQQANIIIPKYCIAHYNHDFAAQFLCSECLGIIEHSNPSCNLLFLSNTNDQLSAHCLDSAKQGFTIIRHRFTLSRTSESELQFHVIPF